LKNFIRFDKIKTNSGGGASFVGTKNCGGEKRSGRTLGRAKIPSPQPLSFLPARAFSFGSAARSAAISRDFVQNEFQLFPTNTTIGDLCRFYSSFRLGVAKFFARNYLHLVI
jgi:hypothetical protein